MGLKYGLLGYRAKVPADAGLAGSVGPGTLLIGSVGGDTGPNRAGRHVGRRLDDVFLLGRTGEGHGDSVVAVVLNAESRGRDRGEADNEGIAIGIDVVQVMDFQRQRIRIARRAGNDVPDGMVVE